MPNEGTWGYFFFPPGLNYFPRPASQRRRGFDQKLNKTKKKGFNIIVILHVSMNKVWT